MTLTKPIIFPTDEIFKSFLYRPPHFHSHRGKRIKAMFVLITLEDDQGLTIKHFDIKVIRALELSREMEMEKHQKLTCCWTSLYSFLIGNLP